MSNQRKKGENPFSTFKPAVQSFQKLFKRGLGLGPAFFVLIKSLFYFLHKLISFLGLWAPGIYCLFGVVLYFGFSFNPFEGDPNSALFVTGFAITCISAVIITGRNLLVRPFLYIREKVVGSDNDIKPDEFFIDKSNARKRKTDAETLIRRKAAGELKRADERPLVYYSKIEPDTLVHEYSDRFEVFRVRNGKPYIYKIEYKE